jgi:nitroreductase
MRKRFLHSIGLISQMSNLPHERIGPYVADTTATESMTVDEAIRHRRSIRRFAPDAVSVAALRDILTTATLAPNIANRQMWRYIVISDTALLAMLARQVERKLNEMATWPEFERESGRLRAWRDQALHFAEAPAVVVMVNTRYRTSLDAVLVEHGMRPSEVENLLSRPDIQSGGAVIAFFMLLAEARGYATCWLTAPLIARKDLQATLELKPGEEILAFISIGKPAEYPPPRPRRSVDEIIEWR